MRNTTKLRLVIIIAIGLLNGCKNPSNPKPTTNKQTPTGKGVVKTHALSIKTIALLPYRGFDTTWIRPLQRSIQSFYQLPVQIMPLQAIPAMAWYAPRQRYKADSLLVFQRSMAREGSTIVGLMHHDISTRSNDNPDWGVFGLGYCPGQACVISTWRLASNSKAQLQERLYKVVLHELGHNLGMPHCTSDQPTCLMSDANGTMAQVDRERLWLCDGCKGKM